MRLLAGLLAGQRGRFVLDGDDSLRARPMERVVAPLRAMGARIAARDGGYAPLTIDGGELRAIRYESPVASAQVKSCVLLAGLLADGETVVVEPAPSRDHTERLLAAAGATLRRDGAEVGVRGAERLALERVVVPGDLSSAAFLVAAALLVPGSHLRITGRRAQPDAAGFLRGGAPHGRRGLLDRDRRRRRRAARRPRGAGLGPARRRPCPRPRSPR